MYFLVILSLCHREMGTEMQMVLSWLGVSLWLVLANDLGAEAKCEVMITTERMQGPPSPPHTAWNTDPVDVVGCNAIFNQAAEGNATVMAEPGSIAFPFHY